MNTFSTVIRSLHFQEDHRVDLRSIDTNSWPALLDLTDRSRLTLAVGERCRGYLPNSVQNRIDANLTNNAARYELLREEFQRIAGALRSRSIEFVVLKGLSQIAPYYIEDPRRRPQYDLDFYCPPESAGAAWNALLDAGFAAVHSNSFRTDHFPPMIRGWNWKWRGDYYALDLPLTVELHFRFWDPQTERIPAPFVESFWDRRVTRVVDDLPIPMLSLADSVSYSALHLVRHLLRGDLRVYHVYELAHFLDRTEREDELWNEWRTAREMALHPIEAVAFRLAFEWFGCKMHPIVASAVNTLPAATRLWFELFRYSPLEPDRFNKDELLLHLTLVSNPIHRCRIVARRMLPLGGPRVADPRHRDLKLLARRAGYHLRSALPMMGSLFRWKLSRRKYGVR